MDFILKTTAILMLLFLIGSQVILASPMSERLYTDDLNGVPIKSYQTTIRSGVVTLDCLGAYKANSAEILINGDHVRIVDRFPVRISLAEGDVVEILAQKGCPSFYVYLAEISSGIATDMSNSTVSINPGINRILKANASR